MEDSLMLLCDIGNTSFHFLDGDEDYKKDAKTFEPSTVQERVFYICVNPDVKNILKPLKNWVDLSLHVDMSKYYETIGIDRVIACEDIGDGIVIDAGSAITVDLVKSGKYEGGFIYPGLMAMSNAYKNISTVLDYSFNFELDLDKMPKNSRDSISYGYLKTLQSEVLSHNMKIVLTGGDAKEFAKIFTEAIIDERVVFNGMKKIMKKANIC
ncbi:type III pantothenate kinase [Candidatus Sulfurimonas marisnigri]|nr:type III pantothenate kinase [Candidatus Sulfurimonas marisnigri]